MQGAAGDESYERAVVSLLQAARVRIREVGRRPGQRRAGRSGEGSGATGPDRVTVEAADLASVVVDDREGVGLEQPQKNASKPRSSIVPPTLGGAGRLRIHARADRPRDAVDQELGLVELISDQRGRLRLDLDAGGHKCRPDEFTCPAARSRPGRPRPECCELRDDSQRSHGLPTIVQTRCAKWGAIASWDGDLLAY
jgi:hypothetical protein